MRIEPYIVTVPVIIFYRRYGSQQRQHSYERPSVQSRLDDDQRFQRQVTQFLHHDPCEPCGNAGIRSRPPLYSVRGIQTVSLHRRRRPYGSQDTVFLGRL